MSTRPQAQDEPSPAQRAETSERPGSPRAPHAAAPRLEPRRALDGVDGVEVFYRESTPPPDAPVMMHLHGFGLSGRYLLPTAERLAGEFHTLVPDLPGFGRSGNAPRPARRPRPRARRSGVPRRPRHRVGHARRQLDGLPGHLRVRPPLPRAASTAPCSSRRPAGCTTSRCSARSASWPATGSGSRPADAGRGARLPALRRAQHVRDVPRADAVPDPRAAARAARSRRSSSSATGTR